MINKELEDQIECLKFTRGVMKTEAHNRKIGEGQVYNGSLDIAFDWRKLCWHTVPKLIEEVEFLDRVVQELHDEREAASAVVRLEREKIKLESEKILLIVGLQQIQDMCEKTPSLHFEIAQICRRTIGWKSERK